MKTAVILALLAFAAAEPDYYVFEDMDMDKMVDNIDELTQFTQCLLENIPCNKVHESYRVHTAESVKQFCKRCHPHIRHMFWQYLQAIKSKLPNNYIEFRHKYDPENKYFDDLETEMEKYAHE